MLRVSRSGNRLGVPGGGTIPDVLFLRYESATPNRYGRNPGIFALANGLARAGRLSEADRAWWRRNNDWFDIACTDPARVDPDLFDRRVHPTTSCWFRATAHQLLLGVTGYLELLDRYGVEWVERRSSAPGSVLFEDEVQVVVRPFVQRGSRRSLPDHPLSGGRLEYPEHEPPVAG